MEVKENRRGRGEASKRQAKRTMLMCVGSGHVGASRGPEVRGSEPSAFPHLTSACPTLNIDYWSTVVVVMRMRSLPDIMIIVFDLLLRLLGWLCSFTDVYTWQCHSIIH